MLQITGFGMTGPRCDEPGFGKVGEAMSGVVGITGLPDQPLHSSFSHGDSVTGLMGAFGVMAALYRRANDSQVCGRTDRPGASTCDGQSPSRKQLIPVVRAAALYAMPGLRSMTIRIPRLPVRGCLVASDIWQ